MQSIEENPLISHFHDKVVSEYSESLWEYLISKRIRLNPISDNFKHDSPVLLIRHALASKNFEKAVQRVANKGKVETTTDRSKLWKLGQIDSGVHEYGRMHIECIRSYYNKFKFKKVYVSSLRRAMESCLVMFSTHPLREQIEIVVEPLLRESLDMAYDIPLMSVSDFKSIQEELSKQGIKLNLEKVLNSTEPHAHVADSFLNERGKADKIEFLKLVEMEGLSGEAITKRYGQFLFEKMGNIPDFRYQSREDVEERCRYVAKFLRQEYLKQEREEDEKIVAVTHSFIINNICKGDSQEVHTVHGEIFPMPWHQ